MGLLFQEHGDFLQGHHALVIHAINVHQGGGRTLLLSLLSALRQPVVVLLDKRLAPLPCIDPQVRVLQVSPSAISRLRAEYQLRALCGPTDTLLCFGNLPPLFANRAKVFVYLQNRYLTSARRLAGLPWPVQIRIRVERLWLRYCLRNARLLVQTETMAQEVREHLGVDCHVLPFLPLSASVKASDSSPTEKSGQTSWSGQDGYDYLYVASGEPHKNHRGLVRAWIILANRNCLPSLCLTLDPQKDAGLWSWIETQARHHGLRITNRFLPPGQADSLYKLSGALIYPSLFESFGLPLLEARAAGLEIIASERDYVRDVVVPTDSFDPESPLSIARAVLRHRSLAQPPVVPGDAASFLQQLERLA